MDEYVADEKEAADLFDEVAVPLSEKIVVSYTLQNFPKEYDVVKQIIFNERKLLSYF